MFCKKCGHSLKDTEKFCPKCGTPVKTDPQPAEPVSSGGLFMSQEAPKEESADTGKGADIMSAAAEKAKEFIGDVKEFGEKNIGKEGGAGKLFQKVKPAYLIALGGILVVLLLVIANGARLGNFMHKTFSSPEKYYQYVEKKEAEEMASVVGDVYESYFLDWLEWYDKSISGEVSIEIGEAGEDYLSLAGLAGVDLSWLKSFSVKGDANIKGDVVSVGAAFGLNKQNLLSGNMLLDMDSESIYLQVPEVSKKYIGMDAEGEFEDYQEMLDEYKEMESAFPSRSQVEKIAERYIKIALECIDDVSKDTKTLEAEGVKQKCTELEVTIDDDTLEAIMEAVLEEMQDDKDIKKLIVNFADAAGEDGDDVYDFFVEEIEDMADVSGALDGMGLELVMKVYVDGKGDIRGRSIEFGDGYEAMALNWLMPVKGGKFGFEASAEMMGTDIKVQGSGKISGDKITGDFKVKAASLSILSFTTDKLDTEKLKRGRLDGGIEIGLSSGISNLMDIAKMIPGASMASPVISKLQQMTFTIDSKASDHGGEVRLGVKDDGEELGAVVAKFETGSGSKKSIPSGKNVIMVEDDSDFDDWLDTCEWDKLISSLEKMDVPSQVIDMLEALEDGDIGSLMYYLY